MAVVRRQARAVLLAGALQILGCGGETSGYFDRDHPVLGAAFDAATPAAPFVPPAVEERGVSPAEVSCKPAHASDRLPPRSTAMRRSTSRATAMSTDDLFEQFKAHCVGCHVDTDMGDFQLFRRDFQLEDGDAKKRAQLFRALERIRSNDEKLVMPPPPEGKSFAARAPGDPLVQFAALFETWLDAGGPKDVFYPDQRGEQASDAYLLAPEVGGALTNLGNCIPRAHGFGSEREQSEALDRKFQKMSELPERLDQTDLFTLDSEELAQFGVVAFAPAYPLWSDDAKKLRHLRVPRGQAITFDANEQSFVIPDNTRFYKTFLKEVIDNRGNKSYRKMETRLIVARRDDDTKDGAARVRALFGTYVWNERESQAVLVRDPLRNGKPFRDRLITYYVDEQKVDALVQSGVPDLERQLREQKLSRKYAIPGSERCIHCHLGAPARSFILGFLPLQIRRRPLGQSGVIEAPGPDEVDQLERLIDYGVIRGIGAPEEITSLEDSQGARRARTEHELVAQGYLLGNCAHCHNPRGFASWAAPELRDVLSFMPSASGGVFEFPLDRFSPRIFRGIDLDIAMPYLTPSLYDLPDAYTTAVTFPKVALCRGPLDADQASGAPEFAPWRSLIYRNVSTPFSYSDDHAIFPHMPRDTAGFDCRAQQLLGTWMVSIPAKPKVEFATAATSTNSQTTLVASERFAEALARPEAPDALAQPYTEVRRGELGYDQAVQAAALRLHRFQQEGRYTHCPDPTAGIVDPEIEEGDRTVPLAEPPYQSEQCESVGGNVVPERPHWFVQDLTEAAVTWSPRRADWRDVLDGKIPHGGETTSERERNRQNRNTVRLLTGRDPWGTNHLQTEVLLDESLRKFSLTRFPLGLWQKKAQCDLGKELKAGDWSLAVRPHWFTQSGADFGSVPPDAPVYTIAPGAQVFQSICANCHGENADSRGRMADTVADLTGGETRVANLRDGIFGSGGGVAAGNRGRVFGAAASDGITAEDWAARYVLWMGLGGTERTIPPPVLTAVANTRVLGAKRQGLANLEKAGANMLAVAEFLCQHVLTFNTSGGLEFDVARGTIDDRELYPQKPDRKTKPSLALISSNGDAELWERLCTFDNPAPVRVVAFQNDGFRTVGQLQRTHDDSGAEIADVNPSTPNQQVYPLLLQRDSYLEGPAGDHRGRMQGRVTPENLAPWCVIEPQTEPERAALTTAFRRLRNDDAGSPPYCPVESMPADGSATTPSRFTRLFNDYHARNWARRGAMNAGLSVFYYLDALSKGVVSPPVAYDRCEDRR